MGIIASFPVKRNVKIRVVDVEDDFTEFGFAVESLWPADDESTEWDRRAVFHIADDAVLFAQSLRSA